MPDRQSFTVLLSHSNRPVDLDQCALAAMTARYADPRRLTDLPPFEALTALDTQRHIPAGLTVLTLTLEPESACLKTVATFDPPGCKVQHAAIIGDRLVVCLEDALMLFDAPERTALPPVLDATAARRIDDPWFAGLHTVFGTDRDRCIVSASGPDAVLDVDLAAGKVISRTRLPEAIYGRNYTLAECDDLRRHYVSNDYQTTHVNCASPDGDGGIVLSTLFQGDIGLLDAGGRYRVLSHGHVGCHAARVLADGSGFYFADSCNGALVLLDRAGGEIRRHAVGSRWLHDAQQVDGDLFLFCAADRNSLELIDIASGRIVLTRRFDERGGATQFVNIAALPECPA